LLQPQSAVPRPLPPCLPLSPSNPTIRILGDVEYRLDKPMLAFMIFAGAVVGALVGRGLVGDWPRGEVYARPLERAFAVTVREDGAAVAPAHVAEALPQARAEGT
jgi:hypothetical protein